MSGEQLERDLLSRKVILLLTHSIEDGTFSDGARLPGERSLADLLGISRQSLRDSLRLLAERSIVDVRHGSGTYLCDDCLVKLRDYLDETEPHPLTRNEYDQFMEAREIFEINAVVLAARRSDEETLFHLNNLVRQMDECRDNYDRYRILDSRFHISLVLATRNPVLISSYSTIRESLYSYYKEIGRYLTEMRFSHGQTQIEHARLFQAIESRDEETARAIMTDHMACAKAVLNVYLDKNF